jgi:hypothetical protein
MRILATALAALALTVAGCGGGSGQNDVGSYRQDFLPLNRSLVALGKQVGAGLQTARGKSDARLEREFGAYADRLTGLQKDFARLHPPQKLAREQKDLVRTIGRVQRSLRGIARASRRHDFKAAERSASALVLSSIGLKRARERLVRDVRKG